MAVNNTSKNIKWIEIARRGKAQPLLVVDSVVDLYRQGYFKAAHKTKWSPSNYRQYDSARWFGENDYKKYIKLIQKASVDNSKSLLVYGREYNKRIEAHKCFADKYTKYDFSQKSNEEIKKIFNEWFEITKRFWCFAYDYIYMNKFLPDIITSVVASKVYDIKRQNEYLGILFEADQSSDMRKEKKELMDIALKIKKHKWSMNNSIVHNKLSKHLEKYAHLGFYYFRGSAYQITDLKIRLQEYIKLNKRELKIIEGDFKKQENNKYIVDKIIKELSLDRQTVKYIKYVKRWGSLSNHVDETYGYVVHKCWKLWQEISLRLGISYKEYYHLTGEEIIHYLGQCRLPNKIKKEIKIRHKAHAIELANGKKKIYIGKELKNYSKHEARGINVNLKVSELNGQSASPGIRKGRAVIVHTVHDVRKVERGNIMVANSTNPTYVPAMERAGAIITDEGGLLSHAAIISRELKIPCVIGTKIATKILKDGDKIHVDADKGIIKILK